MIWDKLPSYLKISEEKLNPDLTNILASHTQCRQFGVLEEQTAITDVLDDDSTQALLSNHHELISITRELFQNIHHTLSDKTIVFILCTSEGRVIEIYSATDIIYRCNTIGIRPGASLTEKSCGTNALALALSHRRTVSIKGKQHYCRVWQNWRSVATPLITHHNTLVGGISLSCNAKTEWNEKQPLLKLIAEKICDRFSTASTSTMEATIDGRIGHSVSPRQRFIITCLVEGRTCKEIAAALNISPRTVESHLEHLRIKFKAKTTTQLVAMLLNTPHYQTNNPSSTAHKYCFDALFPLTT